MKVLTVFEEFLFLFLNKYFLEPRRIIGYLFIVDRVLVRSERLVETSQSVGQSCHKMS